MVVRREVEEEEQVCCWEKTIINGKDVLRDLFQKIIGLEAMAFWETIPLGIRTAGLDGI